MDRLVAAYGKERMENACRAALIDRYQRDQEKNETELARLRTEAQRHCIEAAVAKRELELVRQALQEEKEKSRVLDAEKRRLESVVASDQGKRQKLRGAWNAL